MRIAINIACIKDNALLLVKKNAVYILFGGQPENTENDESCILRETSEELPEVMVTIGKKYGDFMGKTPHKGDQLTAKVYFGSIKGKITPGAEISDSAFVHKRKIFTLPLSEITRKIVVSLIDDAYL